MNYIHEKLKQKGRPCVILNEKGELLSDPSNIEEKLIFTTDLSKAILFYKCMADILIGTPGFEKCKIVKLYKEGPFNIDVELFLPELTNKKYNEVAIKDTLSFLSQVDDPGMYTF